MENIYLKNKRASRGFALIDTILSMICILILSIPIMQTVNAVRQDRIKYIQAKRLIEIMEDEKDCILSLNSNSEITSYKNIDEYQVETSVSDKLSENIYKYQVVIKKEGVIKSDFYIIKVYDWINDLNTES